MLPRILMSLEILPLLFIEDLTKYYAADPSSIVQVGFPPWKNAPMGFLVTIKYKQTNFFHLSLGPNLTGSVTPTSTVI